MATVYQDAFDIDGNAFAPDDHAVVVSVPHASSVEWVGHLVSIERLQNKEDGSWGASIRMLYANPGSTWGLATSHLRRLDKGSAEYAINEATDRMERAAVLQANSERIATEARNEMFVAQLCYTRAAAVRALA